MQLQIDNDWQLHELDLWREQLPAFDDIAVSAKLAKFGHQSLNPEQAKIWEQIEQHFQRFNQADIIVFALPVWNFGVPYVLKHYIDTITQPQLCFSWSPEHGYSSLLAPKPAIVIASAASDYRPYAGNDENDFCINYLRRWLNVYMNCQVSTVAVSPTVDHPDTVASAKQQAYEQVQKLADKFNE